MPISKDEWVAGVTVDALEVRVLSFLNKHPNEAFTLSEISSGIGELTTTTGTLGIIGNALSMWLVQNVLTQLVKEGKVETRMIKERTGKSVYYKAKPKPKASFM